MDSRLIYVFNKMIFKIITFNATFLSFLGLSVLFLFGFGILTVIILFHC